MGYNGGTNKRGYYRRYHGMYSKSSYRSGEKILSNFLFGGLGLLAAGASALSDLADNAPGNFGSERTHFSPNQQLAKYIICGILALACPIGSFATFTFEFWPIFFSILLFGIIEIIPCALVCSLHTELTFSHYYYKDEIDSLIPACKKNLKILMGLLIALLVLNLYPIVYLILDLTIGGYFEWEGGEGLTMLLYSAKIFLNGFFIYMAYEDFKNTEKIVRENTTIRKPSKYSHNQSNNSSLRANTPKESTSNNLVTSTKALELINDERIQKLIKRDWRNEILFYFYEDLMDKICFENNEFGKNFRRHWFTYEEYLTHWMKTHWELRFCTKAHFLTEDIVKTDIVTLEDFKDQSLFEECINQLFIKRLENEEIKVYNRLKRNSKNIFDLIIFDYRQCRDLKLDGNTDSSHVNHSLQSNFRESLNKALHPPTFCDGNFTTIVNLIETIEKEKRSLCEKDKIDNSCHTSIKDHETNLDNDKHTQISHFSIGEDINKSTNDMIRTDTDHKEVKTFKLPKISGEYVEGFYGLHSHLHISAHHADIQFYFPGPDLRYNGTFFRIPEAEIDNYIKAYELNWQKALELHQKAQELPCTVLKISGEKGMNIEASQNSFTIYLHQYHLPIRSEEQYIEITQKLRIAKLRIEEIRDKLFV